MLSPTFSSFAAGPAGAEGEFPPGRAAARPEPALWHPGRQLA